MKVTNQTTIVIVNNALRLIDNPLLVNIHGPAVFVFALTPYYFGKAHYTDIPNVGENRFKYLFACIAKFRSELKEKFNADLLVLEGTYKQVVDQILAVGQFTDKIEVRVLHQPYEYEFLYENELVRESDGKYNASIINKGMTLLPMNVLIDIYTSNKNQSFLTFHFACLRQQNKIQWSDTSSVNITPVNLDIKSTEAEGDCINFFYDIEAIDDYIKNKSLISGGSTTRLEAALSLGTMSKALAYGLALNAEADDANKGEFIRSLIWNDYCWVIAQIEENKIFTRHGLNKDLNNGKLEVLPDWIKGTGTGVKFYNKTITKLMKEGYLPNRTRMLLGYYVIKVMKYSHLAYAEYLEHYLLGFNPHNNWLGAHSCNGTGVDTVIGGRNFNIKTQLEAYDHMKEYL